ncbi:MAG: ComEC/Rec2 family competence protein [Patescibacteria group bacterium]|nr:ComEC/Rec2 family competence protein [Patescibacteria group bacterium]
MRREKILHWFELRRRMFYLGAFLFGIIIHSITPLLKYSVNIWVILSLALCLAFSLTRGGTKFFALIIFCFAMGLVRFDLSVPPKLPLKLDSSPATIQSVWQGTYGKKANIKIPAGNFLEAPSKIQIDLKNDIAIGSKVLITCDLQPRIQEDGDTKYKFYMWQYYSHGYCKSVKLNIVSPPAWYDLRNVFAGWRNLANKRINSSIPGDEGVLVAGLLYGERNLTPQAKDLFRRAGLTHIIAVSGSNFTIIVTVVFSILLGIGLWRHQAFTITTAAMLLFFGFVGFSASVARAAIMGWILLLARHLGRSPNIWHLCLLSAALLSLYDPWMFAFDAGFALSFLATIGLVIWTPIFTEKFKYLPATWGLREAAATTFAATLMTTPYISLVFERISLAGLFTNLIAVPIVPWAMLFGAVTAVFGSHIHFINLPTLGLSKIIFLSARIAEVFPWMDIHISGTNFFFCVGTYVLIIRLWFLLRQKNELYTKQSIFCNEIT